jgi:hypothetical protein
MKNKEAIQLQDIVGMPLVYARALQPPRTLYN